MLTEYDFKILSSPKWNNCPGMTTDKPPDQGLKLHYQNWIDLYIGNSEER